MREEGRKDSQAPLGARRFTSPQSKAVFASTSLPVNIMSIARERPMSRGSRTVPPSISGTPEDHSSIDVICRLVAS